MGALLPMNIFLRQEIDRIKKVIGIVQKTLCDLKLAIDGTIVMSQGLRESLDAMYDARIPQKWQKVNKIYDNLQKLNRTYFKCVCNLGILGIGYARFLVYRVVGTRQPV